MLNRRFLSNLLIVLLVVSYSLSGVGQLATAQLKDFAFDQSSFDLNIEAGSDTYKILAPNDNQSIESFDELSQFEKNRFIANRVQFMQQLAKGLKNIKYGFGVTSIVGDKIKYVAGNTLDKVKDVISLTKSDEQRAKVLEKLNQNKELRIQKYNERAELTLKERSQQIIQNILIAFDRTIWSQAKLFARSNEFGVQGSLGLALLGGIEKKGGWGGAIDVGISIGFNRDNKSLVIQIYSDFERFKSTKMKAAFVAGLVAKAGIHIANQSEKSLRRKGETFYPPAIPAYNSMTKGNYQTGFSSGITIPPSPIGDMMTYTNSLDTTTLVRIELSPLLKGFVKLQTGIGRETLNFIVEPVMNVINRIFKSEPAILRCTNLFI